MNIQYIRDTDVTDLLDKQIRLLLSSCFTNEQDADIFSRQRFYNEMPQHRYLLWQQEDLIGHIAVHDKKILIDDVEYSISGIAEVCIAPKWRRHGYVKAMLKKSSSG